MICVFFLKKEENNGYILALADPEDLAAYAEDRSCLSGVSWDYICSGSQKIGKDSVNTVLILPTHLYKVSVAPHNFQKEGHRRGVLPFLVTLQ